jgi:ferredoxin
LGPGLTLSYLFFRFDPLLFILLSIAGRTVLVVGILSLLLLGGTLVFGRFFCGFVCPLGTLIDAGEPLFTRINKTPVRPFKHGKYLILIVLIAAAAAGVSLSQYFDPLAIMARSLTLILYPALTYFIALVTPLKETGYTEYLIALGSFILILGLGYFSPRFWCRNLCPLGGLLALVARFSRFKFAFRDGCTRCGMCARICPTAAINEERQTIDPGECVACLRCTTECRSGQIGYRMKIKSPAFDVKRRETITALAAGVIILPMVRRLADAWRSDRLIRPPGSRPETDFMNACLRCGLCQKVCPTNGLQPCVAEAGLTGLWTPRLVPRIGGCEKNCHACGQVCPTSAIRNLPLEEKSYAKIGTSVIDRSRCIAWAEDKPCLICDEACQYNAIDSRSETIRSVKLLRPFVDERICIGCGICESRCPVEGNSAIRIFSLGEERKKAGSYITEEKVRLRKSPEKPEDLPNGFITE